MSYALLDASDRVLYTPRGRDVYFKAQMTTLPNPVLPCAPSQMGCFVSGDSRFDSGPLRGAHEDAVAPLLVVPDEARVGALHGRHELSDLGAQHGGN